MRDLRKLFGARIRELRKAKKLTQVDLASRADIDHREIRAIEEGRINITIDHIEKISKGLGVPVFKLFLFSLVEKQLSAESIQEELIRDMLEGLPEMKEALVKISSILEDDEWRNAIKRVLEECEHRGQT